MHFFTGLLALAGFATALSNNYSASKITKTHTHTSSSPSSSTSSTVSHVPTATLTITRIHMDTITETRTFTETRASTDVQLCTQYKDGDMDCHYSQSATTTPSEGGFPLPVITDAVREYPGHVTIIIGPDGTLSESVIGATASPDRIVIGSTGKRFQSAVALETPAPTPAPQDSVLIARAEENHGPFSSAPLNASTATSGSTTSTNCTTPVTPKITSTGRAPTIWSTTIWVNETSTTSSTVADGCWPPECTTLTDFPALTFTPNSNIRTTPPSTLRTRTQKIHGRDKGSESPLNSTVTSAGLTVSIVRPQDSCWPHCPPSASSSAISDGGIKERAKAGCLPEPGLPAC
ncbi:MAG: hypothetical protein MMC23_001469 [Stictis urceolatum]|nr:hypothetical protein [Stictis urceolata]